MERADFLTRVAASFFEAVVIGLLLATELVLLVWMFLGWSHVEPGETASIGVLVTMWTFVLIWHLLLLGLTALEVFIRKGIGKVLLGLEIADESGGVPSSGALWMRWAIKYAPLIALLAVGIPVSLVRDQPPWVLQWLPVVVFVLAAAVFVECLFALGPKRQALHDRWTRTAVKPLPPE